MPSRTKPLSPAAWLRANGVDLAPLTGTDYLVLDSVAKLWELYATSRSSQVLDAIRDLLGVMQPKCRVLTKKLIARAMDWSDVDKLWPAVSRGLVSEAA